MEYLVIISLVFHFISFFLIVILYQRIESQKPIDQDKAVKEMEDLLVSYTTEMKENNERLARRVSMLTSGDPIKKEPPKVVFDKGKTRKKRTAIQHKDKFNNGKYKPQITYQNHADETNETDETYIRYTPPLPSEEIKSLVDSSNTSKILSLSAKGYSASEIARELKMGAGEVELQLKFYK